MRIVNIIQSSLVAAAAFSLVTGCGTTSSSAPHAASASEELDKDLASVPGASSAKAESNAKAESKMSGSDKIAQVASVKASGPVRHVSDDAREDFDKAVAKYEKAKQAGGKGAACADAAEAFGKVADANPTLLEARHNQAAVYLECGRKDEAARIWEKLAAQRYPPALANLGYLAWQKGDAAGAESYFNRSVDADKQAGSVAARLNLAQLLRDRARRSHAASEKNQLTQDAVRHLRTVLAIDGNNLQAYATLCYFYYDLGQLDMARLVGDQAIRRAAEIATGKFEEDQGANFGTDKSGKKTKGKAGAGAGAEAKAKEASKDAGKEAKEATQVVALGSGFTPEMQKQLAVVNNTLGLVWLKRKDVSKAIASFKEAVKLDPALNEGRLNLAALALNFRDYPTAEENFRAVLAAQPRNYDATLGLGVSLRGNRKVDEAEQQYLAARQLDSKNPDSYFNLGVLYQEYKGVGDKPLLQKAQQFYRDYIGHQGTRRKEAEKRIKDIDEMFAALEEMAKLQKEADEVQRKADEQQKKMEEDLKKMQELEKAQQSAVGTKPAEAKPEAKQAEAKPAPAGEAAGAAVPPTQPPPPK